MKTLTYACFALINLGAAALAINCNSVPVLLTAVNVAMFVGFGGLALSRMIKDVLDMVGGK